MTSGVMTSHRTMARALLFLSLLIASIQPSGSYDLNHVQDVTLLRHRRQGSDVIERFLQSVDSSSAGLIVMLDRSKYVTSKIFHTEVMQLLANILRYHVLQNKVALISFAKTLSVIHNGFLQAIPEDDKIKCKLLEGEKGIWSKVRYSVEDEEKEAGPNYKAAFTRTQQLSYTHTANQGQVVILVISAGDEGEESDSNLWLRNPSGHGWLNSTRLFVATTSNAEDTGAITSVSRGNYASVATWLSALQSHQGNMADLNLQAFTEGDAVCDSNNPSKFCNPFTGSSFCTSCQSSNPQPLVVTQSTTTTQAVLERLTTNTCDVQICDESMCKNGYCRSPHGMKVCYCSQGYTGTDCQKTACKACEEQSKDCTDICLYQASPLSKSGKKTIPPFALIIPCAVGGFIILLVIILLICVCCRKNGKGGGGGTTKKKKTPPPPPDASLKPIGIVVPSSRPQRIRDTTPEEDNLYAHYGKIPRHQNMPEWLGYIEEMVTIGHMEAAAIVKYDTSEWVCSERAFKVNQKEYDVLGRLLDKRMPNYKVKFKRKEYFLVENDGESLVMESFNPRGEWMVVLSRTKYFLIAVKVTRLVGLESAKNEVEWIKEAINQQEL